MKDLQENIVSSVNQNVGDYFPIPGGDERGPKILLVGNSITKHGILPSIGWLRDCGMAASCLEKDYAHLLTAKVRETHPGARFAILQAANFEREFPTYEFGADYEAAKAFAPDIILFYFGANVPKEYDDGAPYPVTFGEAVKKLRLYLDPDKRAHAIFSAGFYIRPKLDAEKRALAAESHEDFVEMDDYQNDPATHGEYNHPNDYGMQLIADRFYGVMKKYL